MRVRKMPKDCAENPARYLNLGDHIQSPLVDGWIHHVGIYAGDEKVRNINKVVTVLVKSFLSTFLPFPSFHF